jgi:hypothetical protein
VACVPPQILYLLDKTGFQNSDICEVFSALEKLLTQSSSATIRGIEIGKVVMFGFKLTKISRSDITSNLRCASSGTRPVRKRHVVC